MSQYMQVIQDIEAKFGRKIRDFSELGDGIYTGQWLVSYEMSLTGIGHELAIIKQFIAAHPLIASCEHSDFQTIDGVASFHIENQHGDRPKLTVKAQFPDKQNSAL